LDETESRKRNDTFWGTNHSSALFWHLNLSGQ
jgi:hypothetical protein